MFGVVAYAAEAISIIALRDRAHNLLREIRKILSAGNKSSKKITLRDAIETASISQLAHLNFCGKVEIGFESVKRDDDPKRGRQTYVYTDRPTCVCAVMKRRVVGSVREYTEGHGIPEDSWNGLTSLPAGCGHGTRTRDSRPAQTG